MRNLIAILFLAATALGQADAPQLQPDDAIRIREFYRFAEQIQDKVWPGWSKVPAPLLLVTEKTEFLACPPAPPNGFQKIGDDLYARPRQFPVQLQATFPLLGPPALIAVGRPKNTESGSSTPWLIMVMHERFHQLQYAQPGYYEAVQKLGLSKGFVRHLYSCIQQVAQLRKFIGDIAIVVWERVTFQLWQEGVARYTQIKVAEAAADYKPSADFAALSDYEPFATVAAKARGETLEELKRLELPKQRRIVVYSFGGAEGLLLDRVNPKWRDSYFQHLLTTEQLFE